MNIFIFRIDAHTKFIFNPLGAATTLELYLNHTNILFVCLFVFWGFANIFRKTQEFHGQAINFFALRVHLFTFILVQTP